MRLQTRVIHTHDTEENWNKCINFIPYKGEMIVYDVDATHNHQRAKIGDGINTIVNLPFAIGMTIDDMFNTSDDTFYIDGGRITDK